MIEAVVEGHAEGSGESKDWAEERDHDQHQVDDHSNAELRERGPRGRYVNLRLEQFWSAQDVSPQEREADCDRQRDPDGR